MTELSHDARELIARARPAEHADASAKQRVRAALAAHLGPPPPAPASPAGPAAAGALGAGVSASKLVLICSLAAAGVVGTAALVKTRHSVEHGPIPRPIAREASLAVAPPASPESPDPGLPAVAPPMIAMRDISQPSLPRRDGEPVRRVSPRARPSRAAEPAELPTPAVAFVVVPEPAGAAAIPPVFRAVPEPHPSESNPSSSWKPSNLPAPIPDRKATRITLAQSRSMECSADREIELLSGAQAALRAADGLRAIDLLKQHAESCPSATFWEERSAARVLALCLLHREPQALAEAARLASLAPRSPLLARLRTSCAAAAVKP